METENHDRRPCTGPVGSKTFVPLRHRASRSGLLYRILCSNSSDTLDNELKPKITD